jgi:hypothetical protein
MDLGIASIRHVIGQADAALYRNGRRVFFRARVSGLPGASLADYVAAERGLLWAAKRKGDEQGLVPIPLPDNPSKVVHNDRATWSQDRFLAYEVNGSRVQICCKYDWDLLRIAVTEGIRGQQPESGSLPPC